MAKLRLSIIKKLIRAFKEGATISSACQVAGISRSIYYDWTRRVWPKLGYHFNSLMDDTRVELVQDAMYKSAINGDVNAQKNILLNKRKGWRLGDPKDSRPAVVVQNTVTQNNTPKQIVDDEEELRKNADLIRKFSLTDRYGSKAGEGVVSGVLPEGQQRSESSERTDTSGDSGAHSPVQEAQ
jgi:hypothetical protein